MNQDQIRATVLSELPEIDTATLAPDRPLREQVDLDSFDWLRFLVALHERLQVEIPESDYARLGSVDQLVAYLAAKTP